MVLGPYLQHLYGETLAVVIQEECFMLQMKAIMTILNNEQTPSKKLIILTFSSEHMCKTIVSLMNDGKLSERNADVHSHVNKKRSAKNYTAQIENS